MQKNLKACIGASSEAFQASASYPIAIPFLESLLGQQSSWIKFEWSLFDNISESSLVWLWSVGKGGMLSSLDLLRPVQSRENTWAGWMLSVYASLPVLTYPRERMSGDMDCCSTDLNRVASFILTPHCLQRLISWSKSELNVMQSSLSMASSPQLKGIWEIPRFFERSSWASPVSRFYK